LAAVEELLLRGDLLVAVLVNQHELALDVSGELMALRTEPHRLGKVALKEYDVGLMRAWWLVRIPSVGLRVMPALSSIRPQVFLVIHLVPPLMKMKKRPHLNRSLPIDDIFLKKYNL